MTPRAFFLESFGPPPWRPVRRAGMAFGADGIAVVQAVEEKDGPRVEKAFFMELSADPAETGRLLRLRLDEESADFQSLAAVLPQRAGVVKLLQVPSTRPAEIASMLELQAHRQLPFAPEEILLDHEVLEKDGAGHAWARLSVARREDVEEVLKILTAAGLAPDRAVLSGEAVLPWLARPGGARGPVTILRLLRDGAELGVLEEGRLFFSRWIPGGPASGRLERIVKEAAQSLARHDKDRPLAGRPRPLFLAGAGQDWDAWRAALERDLPVVVAPADLPLGTDLPFPGDFSAAFIAAVAPAPSGGLIPPETARALRLAKHRAALTACGLLAAVLLLNAGGLFAWRVHRKKDVLRAMERERAALADQVREVGRWRDRLDFLRRQREGRGTLFEALGRLNRLVPQRVTLRSLGFERDRSLLLQGAAFSLADAVETVKKLEASGLFTAVELRSSAARRLHDRDMVDFQVHCRLDEGEKE